MDDRDNFLGENDLTQLGSGLEHSEEDQDSDEEEADDEGLGFGNLDEEE